MQQLILSWMEATLWLRGVSELERAEALSFGAYCTGGDLFVVVALLWGGEEGFVATTVRTYYISVISLASSSLDCVGHEFLTLHTIIV